MYKLNNEFEINYNKEIIPKKLNPDLDKKLEKEVNFFLKWGYLIIDKALTDNQIVLLRKTFNKTFKKLKGCLLYTSPSPRDQSGSRMPSSA